MRLEQHELLEDMSFLKHISYLFKVFTLQKSILKYVLVVDNVSS